jgi:hypothetical protein
MDPNPASGNTPTVLYPIAENPYLKPKFIAVDPQNPPSKAWWAVAVLGSLVVLGGCGLGTVGLLESHQLITLPPELSWLSSFIGTIGNTPGNWSLWVLTWASSDVGFMLIALSIHKLRQKEQINDEQNKEIPSETNTKEKRPRARSFNDFRRGASPPELNSQPLKKPQAKPQVSWRVNPEILLQDNFEHTKKTRADWNQIIIDNHYIVLPKGFYSKNKTGFAQSGNFVILAKKDGVVKCTEVITEEQKHALVLRLHDIFIDPQELKWK